MNFQGPKLRKSGSSDVILKSCPEDFVVNEISQTREQAGACSLCQVLPELGDGQIFFSAPAGEQPEAPFDATFALDAELIAQLSMLNSQSREAVVSKEVVEAPKVEKVEVPNMPVSKAERRAIFDFINSNFPYIRPIDGRDSLTLTLTADLTLRSLRLAGLSMACVDAFAAYLKRGASHDLASAGVRIGRGSTKEARTQIYREIAQLPIRLDCRTIDETHKSSDTKDHDVITCILAKFRPNKRKRQDTVKVSASCYLRFVICKRDIEHFRLIASLNKALSNLQPGALNFAGIKDKYAVSSQFATVTISATSEDSNERSHVAAILRAKCTSLARRLISLSNHAILSPPTSESGFIVGDLEYVSAPLQSGRLEGNSFRIVLRGVASEEDTLQRLQAKAELLMQQGGGGGGCFLFPNYFGSQRMGWAGSHARGGDSLPFGPAVGRSLVLGEHAAAVAAILQSNERKEAAEFKSLLAAGAPLQNVLDAMSVGDAGLDRERGLVKALLRFGCSWPPAGNSEDEKYRLALQQISYPLRALWVNSFQSWLWNWAASERVLLGTSPIEGDLLLPPDGIEAETEAEAEAEGEAKEGEGQQAGDVCFVVTNDWLSDMSAAQLQEAGRRVVLPLFGSKIRHAEHAVGRAYAAKLELELRSPGVRPLHAMPRGAYRRVFGRCEGFFANKHSEEESIKLGFQLPSGAFATSLLRELLEQEF